MATRLVRDELDLNLSSLASGLVIVIVVVVGGRGSRTLDAAVLSTGRNRIAIGVALLESCGRGLLVLIGDVGHDDAMDRVGVRTRT